MFFFISIFLLDVFVRCGDHAPLYNYFNLILKNLGMFNVNSFCHLHSFFARCFYPIVEFFVLRKQKRNKLPTTTKISVCCIFRLKFTIWLFSAPFKTRDVEAVIFQPFPLPYLSLPLPPTKNEKMTVENFLTFVGL